MRKRLMTLKISAAETKAKKGSKIEVASWVWYVCLRRFQGDRKNR